MVGGHGGDRLAVVADDVGREDGPVVDAAAVGGGARHVGVRDDGAHARHRGGGRGVDGEDPGVGVRRAQHRGPQQALGPQVGRVRERALGLGGGVGGREGDADAVGRRLGLGGDGGREGGGGDGTGVCTHAARHALHPAHSGHPGHPAHSRHADAFPKPLPSSPYGALSLPYGVPSWPYEVPSPP